MKMPLLAVVEHTLRFISQQALKKLREQVGKVVPAKIRWVLTVPALWSEEHKLFMRKAAVQAEIIDLLLDLRHDGGLALIMISHDLAVVRELCERVAVMHEGSLVEIGHTAAVLVRPKHPATQALLQASLQW